MKKHTHCILGIFLFLVGLLNVAYSSNQTDPEFSLKNLDDLERFTLSVHSRNLLERHGFAVSPGDEQEIYDVYIQAKKKNQPIFVTTDSVMHTCHIFFDYLMRILELEKLFPRVVELTDRMIAVSQSQYEQAKLMEVKEAARLNIGFFFSC
jgi:hypothetical protein